MKASQAAALTLDTRVAVLCQAKECVRLGQPRILRGSDYQMWRYWLCNEHERLFSDSFKKYLANDLKKRVWQIRGQTMTEYALVLAGLALVAYGLSPTSGYNFLDDAITGLINRVVGLF